ncbi:adenylate/guanylate cyclase domain-containing protein [Rhodopseudomonas sp. P2A-2r]|uniref:adenylate/guanylate cyclase domain-containing protein n=1 Tax=unclassified Rhodopseudomonas TaxID=2638247 RepID=UPI002234D412|nr:adenylate/guanylate cyclase domain-containing protein [Rhodopseudomonas sp. P2A-2r]UZE49605.1 adenylate/guanylate cyclase domain-containing protein [Rhodopseudomonas sp. P2A-2r]
MSDLHVQFAALKQAVDPAVAGAIEQLIVDGADHALNRINVLDFAARNGLDEERAIAGFLHAARLGLFDLTWNVLCPGCSGVLDAHGTLKSLRSDDYQCGLCGCGYAASVDEQVEVAFTVAPRIRRIAAHDPNSLPIWEYFRQVFWSSGVDFDAASFASLSDDIVLAARELPAHQKADLALQLPPQFLIVFEPVTHVAQFIDVQGEPTGEVQQLALVYRGDHAPSQTTTLRPGPLRLSLDNQTGARVLPSVLVAADALHHLIGKRKPFVTAKRILSNQTFRDVYKADNLDIDQRLKITSLTFLFTDLKGSTALYERVGDLAAFDLVRAHFHALLEIISSEAGAVVKTIGDAVMATFVRPEQALAAALRMRTAMDKLNEQRGTRDLVVKIGIHEGPCLAVMLNERQDYFGQTVNIAARVQGLSNSQAIHVTGPIMAAGAVEAMLQQAAITPIEKQAALRGITDKIMVYEIP